MNSSLRERLGRLGPVRDIARVPSGSPAIISLSPARSPETVQTVTAALALAKRGLSLLKAKRVLEEMLATGRTVVELPTVEDERVLAQDLEQAGCVAAAVTHDMVDVRALRERLGLSQEQFAWRYGLDVAAIRNWEAGRRRPDPAAQGYLRVIERLPEQVSMALERPLGRPMPASRAISAELSVPDMKAVAVAVMEALHPDRGTESRRMVSRIPESRLGQLLMAAEQVVSARLQDAPGAEPDAGAHLPA